MSSWEILVYAGLSFATSFGNCGFCEMVLWHMANFRTGTDTIQHSIRKEERGRALASVRRRSGIGEHHARTWDSINTKCRLERSGLRWCGHSTESEQGTISIEWEGKRAKIGGVSCRTTGGLHRRQKLTLRRQIQRRQATMTLTDQRTQ